MYLKNSLFILCGLFLLVGCSSKENIVEKEQETYFYMKSINKNLKPISYELNITNVKSGECMESNKSDLGVLSKRDGLIIDTTNNKEDIKDTFIKVKEGDSLELKVCNIDNRLYKFNVKQNITSPIINGKLIFNGKEYEKLNDIQINNDFEINVNETIKYIDLLEMSVKKQNSQY